jgi:molybdopterin synthase catalytic subunit
MIEIVSNTIDREAVLSFVASPAAGSLVTFDGRVRDHARGKRVVSIFYEAYEPMALRELAEIRRQAMERWPLTEVGIVHRIGHLELEETSVFIAVSSPHRNEGFEACRFIIDTIKARVPIWKKEFYKDGDVWVDGSFETIDLNPSN